MTLNNNLQNLKPMSTLLNQSSKKEIVKCVKCGAEFTGSVYAKICGKCHEEERMAREIENNKRDKEQLLLFKSKRQQEMRKLLPLKFQGCAFSNYEKELQLQAYRTMAEWDWDGGSVILASPNVWGVGKTHLVCATVNKIIDDLQVDSWSIPTPFKFTTENDLLLRIRNTYKKNNENGEDEDTIYRELNRIGLLVIDDVGKVIPSDLSFLQRVYFQIINDRYNNNLDVIITTNLDLKQLSQYIGVACADRLYEMCGKERIVIMKGKSYRGNNA